MLWIDLFPFIAVAGAGIAILIVNRWQRGIDRENERRDHPAE